MIGRVAEEVVLSAEERAFLEAQVRRQKAARSLSDRCRMILFCAEGLQSKEVAERRLQHRKLRLTSKPGRATHSDNLRRNLSQMI